MKNKILRIVVQGSMMLVGSAALALSYNLFLMPNQVVPGGVGGLAMLLHHLFGAPVGLSIIVMNIPLFALGVKVLGRSYGAKSLLGLLVSSLLIDFFTYLVPLPAATHNPLLACIFGGLVLGAGLGLVFRAGGSTGGVDILAQVLSRYSQLSTGSAILAIDFVVISLAGAVYGNFELSLYGYVNLYVQTRVVDLVLEGMSYTRAMFIVSQRAEEVARAVTGSLHRGATLLPGRGAYTNEQRTLVFTVMSKREAVRCREIVRRTDPRAFVIITDVYEVLGEGFHPRGAGLQPG